MCQRDVLHFEVIVVSANKKTEWIINKKWSEQTTRYLYDKSEELNIAARGQTSYEFLTFSVDLLIPFWRLDVYFYEWLQVRLLGDMTTNCRITFSVFSVTMRPFKSHAMVSLRYQHETAEFLIVISLVFWVRASHDYLEQRHNFSFNRIFSSLSLYMYVRTSQPTRLDQLIFEAVKKFRICFFIKIISWMSF